MITFKKFILESNTAEIIYNHIDSKIYDYAEDYSGEKLKDNVINNIVTILKRDCQNWISELQYPEKIFPYRGIPGAKNALFMRKNTRRDRRPKDSTKHLHDIWDEWFNKKFGFNARSQSIFITGNRSEASNYGDIYLVYPIGKYYGYLSTRGISDLLHQFPKLYIDAAQNDKEYGERLEQTKTPGYESRLDKLDVFQTMDEKTDYVQDKNLTEFIKAGSEIMVQCDSYYALYADDLDLIKPVLERL